MRKFLLPLYIFTLAIFHGCGGGDNKTPQSSAQIEQPLVSTVPTNKPVEQTPITTPPVTQALATTDYVKSPWQPVITKIESGSKFREINYTSNCIGGASSEPCEEIVIRDRGSLNYICSQLVGGRIIEYQIQSLCQINESFDWNKNRLVVAYASPEDYSAIKSFGPNLRVNFIQSTEYEDHWKLTYTVDAPSPTNLFPFYDGSIQAISIPNDGKGIVFDKMILFSVKSLKRCDYSYPKSNNSEIWRSECILL